MTAAKNSDLNGILWVGGLALGAYVLHKNFQAKQVTPAHLIPDTAEAGVYAFVNNPSGAMMFAKTDVAKEPLYGHGREPLVTKLGDGSYIGKLTGISFEELVQVRTNVEGSDVAFWVRKDDIRTAGSGQFDMANVAQKSQSALRELAHTLIDRINL